MVRVAQSQIEVIDPSTVKLRGYAAVFGNDFQYFDWREWKVRTFRIPQGAFTSVLARLGDKPLDVYWAHETFHLQLGQTSMLRQDDTGLYYEAELFTTAPTVDILGVIDGRDHTGASFGFEFGEIAPASDNEEVEELLSFSEIYELGPCPVGANPLARTELVELDAAEEKPEDEDEPEDEEPDEEPAEEPEEEEPEPEPAEDDAGLAEATWALVAHLRRSNPR